MKTIYHLETIYGGKFTCVSTYSPDHLEERMQNWRDPMSIHLTQEGKRLEIPFYHIAHYWVEGVDPKAMIDILTAQQARKQKEIDQLLEEINQLEAKKREYRREHCTCAKSNWDSLSCPLHGLRQEETHAN